MFGPITVVFFVIVFSLVLAYLLIVPPGVKKEKGRRQAQVDYDRRMDASKDHYAQLDRQRREAKAARNSSGTTTGKKGLGGLRERPRNYPDADEPIWDEGHPQQTVEDLETELRKVEAEMDRRKAARLAPAPSVIVDPRMNVVLTPAGLGDGPHNSFDHSGSYHAEPDSKPTVHPTVHSYDHSIPSHDHSPTAHDHSSPSFDHNSGGSFDGGGHHGH